MECEAGQLTESSTGVKKCF